MKLLLGYLYLAVIAVPFMILAILGLLLSLLNDLVGFLLSCVAKGMGMIAVPLDYLTDERE